MDPCETYEFGDRFASVVPFCAAPSLAPPDAAEDVAFGVAEAGARSIGAEGASVGYDFGLASLSTEGGASGAAEAGATAVVIVYSSAM